MPQKNIIPIIVFTALTLLIFEAFAAIRIDSLALRAGFTICIIAIIAALYYKFAAHRLSGAAPYGASRNDLTAPHTNAPYIDHNLEVAIAEGLQEAIFVINRHSMIGYANQAASDLFPELTLDRPLLSYVRDPDVSQLISDTLAGNIATPISIQRPGSIDRHLRISGTPVITSHKGEEVIDRAVIVFTDVTEIERNNTVRADFLANASHELKTPIASMLGYIETLRGHAKDDPTAREMFLGIMQEQAERMQRLIVDILSLRKIEQIEHIVPTERADLGLATKAALEAVHPIAKSRNVNVTLSGKKKNALVMGSQDELVQLSLNLIDNAVRMSPPESKVSVKVDRLKNWMPGDQFSTDPIITDIPRRRIVTPPQTAQDYWRLSIRDSGPGFKSEHLPRLGERFYRIAGDRNSKEKGTGLGLAIVKHIVRWHRGGLYIESAEKHGTEFIIILPLAHDISDEDNMDAAPIQRGRISSQI